LSILVNTVNWVGVWNEACFTWAAVSANFHGGAILSVVVSTGLVNGASLISDFVFVHPFEGVVGISSVAAIIVRTGDEDLWGNVDIGPCSFSHDLISV